MSSASDVPDRIPAPKEIKQVNDEWRSLQLWFSTKGDIESVAKRMDVPVQVAEIRVKNALERYNQNWVRDLKMLRIRQAVEIREYIDTLREQAEKGSVPAIGEIRQLMAAERKLVGLEEESTSSTTVYIDNAVINNVTEQIQSAADAETLERLARAVLEQGAGGGT